MSLVLAVVAALTIMIMGICTGARISTVFLRGVIGFLVAGGCVYLVVMLLEAKDIVLFDKNLEFPEEVISDSEEDHPEEDSETDESTEEMTADGETGFRPLSEQDLSHVEPPQP